MPKNFRFASLKEIGRRAQSGGPMRGFKDPRIVVRIILGVLLLANVALAIVVFKPFGGSRQDLENQLASMESQVKQRQASLQNIRLLATKVEKGRSEADTFIGGSFLGRRTAYSTLLSELLSMAKSTGIRPKEFSYIDQPIEGSDDMAMLSISGNYEGTYADLVHLLNLIDRSPRFMILEYLQAAPQASTGVLMINMKVNTFVREHGSGDVEKADAEKTIAQAGGKERTE